MLLEMAFDKLISSKAQYGVNKTIAGESIKKVKNTKPPMRSALAKKSKEVVVIPTLGKYNAHISVIGMMENTTKRFAIAGI